MLHAKLMEYKVLLTILAFIFVLVNCDESSVKPSFRGASRTINGTKHCRGCNTRSRNSRNPRCCEPYACCGRAVSDYFQNDQFEKMFSNRNSLEAQAKGFWDYHSFVTASALFQPYGFGTTYINWNFMGTKEIAAFLAHVGTKTSCK